MGMQVNLKFCSMHIVFNINDRFKLSGDDVTLLQRLVFQLQRSRTVSEYNPNLASINLAFPDPIHAGTDGEQRVADYLNAIHPVNWTQFGNFELNEAELALVQSRWKDSPHYGQAVPLFGISTTSAIEGDNNGLLCHNIRDKHPPAAFPMIIDRTVASLTRRRGIARDWMSSRFNITPKAKSVYDTLPVSLY